MNTSKSVITKGGVFSTHLGLTLSFGVNTCAFLPSVKCVGQVLWCALRPQQLCSTMIQEEKKKQQNKSIIQIQQATSCSQADSLPLWTLIWTAQKRKWQICQISSEREKTPKKMPTEELVKLVTRQDESVFRKAAPTGLYSLGLWSLSFYCVKG